MKSYADAGKLIGVLGADSLLQATVQRMTGFTAGESEVSAPIVVCGDEHRFVTAEQLRASGLAASIVVLFGIQTHAFALFFGSFLLLFLTTGFINGASFRMIPYIFDNPFHASLVTGFTAAIAAYGAFLIPKIFGWSYANFQNVAPAFYILIAFTVLTIIITWFFYARKGSGIKC